MEIIRKYFPDLSDEQLKQFAKLDSLYRDWNSKINVVSRKDLDQLYTRHVLHSLAIAKFAQFAPGTKVLDVGTGGGFPGVPLAILFPDTQFTLVDSIGKKIKVVNAVSEEIGLKNISAYHTRAEDVKDDFHFVVSRAVTRLKPFFGWIKGKIKTGNEGALHNGLLALKGGDLMVEIDEFSESYPKYKVQLLDLSSYFKEDFFDTKKLVYVSR